MIKRPPAALLLCTLLAACEGAAPGPRAGVWTLFDFLTAFPETAGGEQFLASKEEIGVAFAFSEGKPAAYTSTELWIHYPAVWAQPMYVPVTKWDATGPKMTWVQGQHWIFPVGAKSKFYSPYWRVVYAVVPEGTGANEYTTVQQILRDKLDLHEGALRLVALAPAEMRLEKDSLAAELKYVVGAPRADFGWMAGQKVPILDYGSNRFETNERREVREHPLFVFTVRGPDGNPQLTNAPNVGGTGPLFSRRPAIAPGGARPAPFFGSYWRLTTVALPVGPPADNVGVFLPPAVQRSTAVQRRADKLVGFKIVGVDWEIPDGSEAKSHFFKIALNARTCFASEMTLPSCVWLDSQAAIEDRLPASITPTDKTVNCPLVIYAGQPVADP